MVTSFADPSQGSGFELYRSGSRFSTTGEQEYAALKAGVISGSVISASYFAGDGAGLTNLPGGGGGGDVSAAGSPSSPTALRLYRTTGPVPSA